MVGLLHLLLKLVLAIITWWVSFGEGKFNCTKLLMRCMGLYKVTWDYTGLHNITLGYGYTGLNEATLNEAWQRDSQEIFWMVCLVNHAPFTKFTHTVICVQARL